MMTTITLNDITFTRAAGAWTWTRPGAVPAAWTEILDALHFGM